MAILWAEAVPQTARELNAVSIREDLPITEIVAEKGQPDPDSAATWRAAQTALTAGHPSRTFILAKGSSHKIVVDQPDLVVTAITMMVSRVAGEPLNHSAQVAQSSGSCAVRAERRLHGWTSSTAVGAFHPAHFGFGQLQDYVLSSRRRSTLWPS